MVYFAINLRMQINVADADVRCKGVFVAILDLNSFSSQAFITSMLRGLAWPASGPADVHAALSTI